MLGDIAFPSATTLAWMAAAALAGAGIGMWPVISRHYGEWQLARRKARGEDTSYEEWESTRYDPRVPSEEERRHLPALVIGLALYFAAAAWALLELDGEVGKAVMASAFGIGAVFGLLRDFRKTDEELGLNAPGRDPMKGPPTFLERYGKQLNQLAAGIFGMGGIALVLLRDSLPGENFIWMGGGVLLILAYVSIRAWRWFNDPPELRQSLWPDASVPPEAVLGAVGAVGIVAGVLGLVYLLS